jgi:hypothetical protein
MWGDTGFYTIRQHRVVIVPWQRFFSVAGQPVGMEDLSRRTILKGLGAAAATGTAAGVGWSYGSMLEEQEDNDAPLRFNIYQTDGMAELAELYGVDQTHAQQVIATYVEDAFDDLLERAGTDTGVETYVIEDPVEMHDDYETTDAMAEDWYDTVDLMDGTASHGNLLIHENHYIDALGQGEGGWTGLTGHVEACGTSGSTSEASVLGNGDQLFSLDPDEVQEDVPWRLYDEEDEEIVSMEPSPARVAISGVHEFGHNTCLGHEHGDLSVTGDGEDRQVEVSVMMGAYYDDEDEIHESVPEVHRTDDIYMTNSFSERAVDEIASRYSD